MLWSTKIPNLKLARGTHYTPGSDYLYFVQGSTGGAPGIYRIPAKPAILIADGRDVALSINAQKNLNNHPGDDLKWDGNTIRALGGARIESLSNFTSYDAIMPNDLLNFNWQTPVNNSLSEDGTSVIGRFYGVRIFVSGFGYTYAKIRVYRTAAGTRIDWTAYILSPEPIRSTSLNVDAYDIVVSNYESEIYLSYTTDPSSPNDGYVGRVTRTISSNFPLNSPYAQYDSVPTQISANALSNPRQIALCDSLVYVVTKNSVVRIDPVNLVQDDVVQSLNNGTGLLLDLTSAGIVAYILDANGLSTANLSDYNGTPIVPKLWQYTVNIPQPGQYTINGSGGFLTWANEEHTAIYCVNQATKKVWLVDLLTGEQVEIATAPTPSKPWSAELVSPSTLYVSAENEIGLVSLNLMPSGVIVLGIGLIPFDYINKSANFTLPPAPNDGKANTSSASGYYFSKYPNLPFGGDLSLMINHGLAWNNGIRYYKLSLKNVTTGAPQRAINSAFTDMKWNPASLPPRFEPVSTDPTGGQYPVRSPADLWYNPWLAAVIATSTADNGHNILKIEFFDVNRQSVAGGTFERLLLIDNTWYNGRLDFPRIGISLPAPPAVTSPPCGCLTYTTKDDLVAVDFAAWHPQSNGEYTLQFFRGNTLITKLSQTGPVTTAPILQMKTEASPGESLKVGHLTASCDVANITITLSIPSRVIDGFGWLDRGVHLARSFTVVRGPLSETPWPQ